MLVTLDVLGVSLVSDESNIYRSPINPHDWFQNSTPDIRPHFTQIQIHEILNTNKINTKKLPTMKHIQNVLYMWKVMTVFLISHIQWALYCVGADWSDKFHRFYHCMWWYYCIVFDTDENTIEFRHRWKHCKDDVLYIYEAITMF